MHTRSFGGRKKANIQIIPLIDIMFFLLAAFMLVSLSMATTKSVKVSLPTAQASSPDNHPNTLAISVDATGGIYLDKRPIGKNELAGELKKTKENNPKVRVIITGDADARHGIVIAVLDRVRGAGIENVAFQTRDPDNTAR